MANEEGMQSMFPVYLPRIGSSEDKETQARQIAQNENNINQNFATLYNKLAEIESILNAQ